jgi:hypothetical protein
MQVRPRIRRTITIAPTGSEPDGLCLNISSTDDAIPEPLPDSRPDGTVAGQTRLRPAGVARHVFAGKGISQASPCGLEDKKVVY